MFLRDHTILGITPFEYPDADLLVAICRAGAFGILDLGRDPVAARAAVDAVVRQMPSIPFGVRVPQEHDWEPRDLPAAAEVVILSSSEHLSRWRPRRVLVQVCSIEEARHAEQAGADGLIAKGEESGGRVGDDSAFILLQRITRESALPIWVQGGIGLHTAAACIAGGAAGLVLDSQLALVDESSLPDGTKSIVSAMDGSETIVVGGHRVFSRPDLPIPTMKDAEPAAIARSLGASDLHRFLLPSGQDAAFASGLAHRFRTAGGVVRAMRQAIAGHLKDARRLQPLAPGSPLAASHGIRYPIVQGPMTRVSDRAAFAAAVADGGGLPFMALSLMRGHEARRLLRDTSALLGGRPWGVGILGFVPPELRDEQLQMIADTRPAAALIAGGRPAQARSLEAQGIPTYLHVPSPGLLDLFLKDGARRFVFEGRECGGHVGPRTSFVLWDSQIERLLQCDHPEELSVLFAGGIHDDRSAAMVAALAAPLAARGARIGVLMGTAYLFTEEATVTGAIQPCFQDAALSCARTVLLETAPGHATRCADTEYARNFIQEKQRLEAQGLDQQDIWATLEQLNLGRLRIAAKGLRRDGNDLVAIDADSQRRDGMVMIGQVAALRGTTTTIHALHERVSRGAAEHLDGLADRFLNTEPARAVATRADAVAIIGIECVFPAAPDRHAYWANIVNGVDAVTEVPPERWDAAIYFDPDAKADKTNSKWGAFVPAVPFDAAAHGIPPRAVAAIDPVQLLSLEVAKRALADAGYADRDFDRDRTSVIFGVEPGTDLANAYSFRALYPQLAGDLPKALDHALPPPTEDSFPGVLGNVVAGRIANRLDLGGVNYTVDAACASSLAALDIAVKELTAGDTDMVLCGGADLHNSINDYLMFSAVRALSPTGRCRTFDAAADGLALGEGIAVIVLKRLKDAERDGDRIYAVIRGVGASSDGRCLSLTAPRKEGQERALERAYRHACVSPADIGLLEAHGTGTVLGDHTELESLTAVFEAAKAVPGSCALGSVKSQIGHTKCAAGMAGLIKVAMSLYHGVLPPTLHVDHPNLFYDDRTSPFHFNGTARPWLSEQRHAGVSAFGFGGTNFHAVLSHHSTTPPTAVGVTQWPAELFLFRGSDRAEACREIERMAQALGRDERRSWRLRDLARTVSNGHDDRPVQFAIVACDVADLTSKLRDAVDMRTDSGGIFVAGGVRGSVAFLFPGQGSQRPGMLSGLSVAFTRMHDVLRLGARWHGRMFPAKVFAPDARAKAKQDLDDTRVAQPALGLAGFATAALLRDFGIEPDVVAGHSYGELVALSVAGCFDIRDLLQLSEDRGTLILKAAGSDPGTMAAVSAGSKETSAVLAGVEGIVIANINAPDQSVISGTSAAVAQAVAALRDAGFSAKGLAVGAAFHSPVVAAAEHDFAKRLANVHFFSPRIPVWSNLDASTYPSEPARIRERLANHLARPVDFVGQIEAMHAAGARIFVEAGPGDVLGGLVNRILGDRPHLTVACDRAGEPAIKQLLAALGALAVHGVPVNATALFEGRDAKIIDFETPAQTSSAVWMVNGHTAWPIDGKPPELVRRPAGTSASAQPFADRDTVALEYLRSMRTVVEAQREVMVRYFGNPMGIDIGQPGVAELRKLAPAAAPQQPTHLAAVESPANLLDRLRAIVSKRTGYPVEMLDPEMDLQADLGIDSIKRIEILGLLGEELGLGIGGAQRRDQIMEELAVRKTMRAVVEWLEEHRADSRPEDPPVAARHLPLEDLASAKPLARYVLSLEQAPAPHTAAQSINESSFVIAEDGHGVAQRLAALLEADGASVRIIPSAQALQEVAERFDAFIYLCALAPGSATHPAKDLFELARSPAIDLVPRIVAATAMGGDFGRHKNGTRPLNLGGVSGLLKSVAKERSGLSVRIVDLNPADDPGCLAACLRAELSIDDGPIEVGYTKGTRIAPTVVAAPHEQHRSPSCLTLHAGSLVLLVGGARGITSQVAIALARRFQCRLELVGRSADFVPDEAGLALASLDLVQLRQALVKLTPAATPAEIEVECSRIRFGHELRTTLAAVRAAGATAHYSQVDVLQSGAFETFLDDQYERYGHIDAVIYGAGVIEDRLVQHKTRESFDRVFDTKVSGALALAGKVRPDIGAVVFFSSVAGPFGSRGQTDYAAANDVLDKLAWSLQERIAGRVVSIDWGPWANSNMVPPELEREYARRGIGLISPERGAEALIDELCYGSMSDTQVILTSADPAILS